MFNYTILKYLSSLTSDESLLETEAIRITYVLTFKNFGGFMNTPTPGGVPVSMTSPGNRVKNFEHHETSSSILKTS